MSGVKPKIRIEENKDSIYLFDMTGKFAEKCNKEGWGTPNQLLNTATAAEFQIYPPKATAPIIVNVFPDFPTDLNMGYELVPQDLGRTKFESGLWRFDFFVRIFNSLGETLLPVSCTMLFTKDVKCCIDKSSIEVNIDNYESKEVAESNALQHLFSAAVDAACLGKVKEVEKIIDHLYSKCKCNC